MDTYHSHLFFFKQYRRNPQKPYGNNLNEQQFTGDLPALFHFRGIVPHCFRLITAAGMQKRECIIRPMPVNFFCPCIKYDIGFPFSYADSDAAACIFGKRLVQFFCRSHRMDQRRCLCISSCRIIEIYIVDIGIIPHEIQISKVNEQRIK